MVCLFINYIVYEFLMILFRDFCCYYVKIEKDSEYFNLVFELFFKV